MNREDIIKLAREAGFITSSFINGDDEVEDDGLGFFITEKLERFAALVAAAAKPQPLPEDQLWKAVDEGERAFVAGGPGTSWTLCVARAIEAAHGIGGEE